MVNGQLEASVILWDLGTGNPEVIDHDEQSSLASFKDLIL
jgi:hypothetical protein